MPLSGPSKDGNAAWVHRHRVAGADPRLGFAVAILAAALVLALAPRALSQDAVMPAVSTLLLGSAALFGLIAWRRGRANPQTVTYADVAGALWLIGLFAAATIEPEQLVRLVSADDSQ